ncbi:MAG: hypothetical protein FJ214_09965 [Ignavibacteria bacterium]|nr:hypothetical protein [Ignavibacteria bacterium]
MKPIVCLYCEGSDAKIAVVTRDKNGIKIHRVSSLTMTKSAHISARQMDSEAISNDLDTDISFDSLDSTPSISEQDVDNSNVSLLQSALYGLNINRMQYLPIITEPVVNYHHYEGPRDDNRKKLYQNIITDIQSVKGITVHEDSVDVTELNEKAMLSVFIEGSIPCVGLINQLAVFNKRRYLKIPTIKVSELSLAYYVSKTNKFFPEDNTLVIYIGKEYSKLIFLEGQKLKHIGATLDIGTRNLHTYDVYFSKILLEMENGGIPKLDNIILCGEDRSENLILSFFGTFPEANVSELKFEDFDTSMLTEDDARNIALYAVPISVAVEYFDELDKKYIGVNFLPKYIQEHQKFLQFGWHSYALLPILFGLTFFLTYQILSRYREINDLDTEINRLTLQQQQNQALVEQITPLDNRINSFDATQVILDSATVGSGLWNKMLTNVSDFVERRRNFWLIKLETVESDEVKIVGYSLSRSVLTEFAQYNKSALLKYINYEPLREKSAFTYTMNFKLLEDSTQIR